MLQIEIEDLDACVVEATCGLFEQMIGAEPIPAPPPPAAPPGYGAIITIGAPSPLRLHIVMPEAMVREVAMAVFALPDQEIGDPECRDLLGEMVNIVGGSLKGMFDDATSLSLPTTFATTTKYQASDDSHQYWFAFRGATFGVWCETIGA
ncbi:MAG: chemotaxis protein CheX [Myxococcota bacterium]